MVRIQFSKIVAPDGQVCSALCWLSARTSPSSPALYPLLCALLPCSVTPGGKLKSCFQLYIDSDFFHLIEGLNRRENLIQGPLLEVVMVNTVQHNVNLKLFKDMNSNRLGRLPTTSVSKSRISCRAASNPISCSTTCKIWTK